MRLPVSLLAKYIDLPSEDMQELRMMLDDLGLEVKSVEGQGIATVFNIETLANRGDHLHVMGVARELSARLLAAIKLPTIAGDLSDRRVSIPVRNTTDKCLRYALMEMTLPARFSIHSEILNALGESAGINPIVDLLNYILLEVGQPMHAFDKEKVEGEVVVELSEKEEKVLALNNKEYLVPKGSLLIKDKKKIIAVAGIIGCANTMVSADTQRVLIESATFDPICVRKTAKAMGISTDASYAFERGVDIEGAALGLKRLLHLSGAASGGGNESSPHVVGCTLLAEKTWPKQIIEIDIALIRKQLNLPRLDAIEITTRLKNLGFSIQTGENDKQIKVGVPSWRIWDVSTSEDLVEEVARALSLSRVKLELPPLDYTVPEKNEIEGLLERVETSLVGNGFYEVITKGFYSHAEVSMLSALDDAIVSKHVAIKNAVDSNYSHMKISNIIHLARLAEQNHRKGLLTVKVYEVGRLFSLASKANKNYDFERETLSMAVSGRWNENEWQKPEGRDEMLLHFKGVIESLVRTLGQELEVTESKEAVLHPGMQAAIKLGRSKVGFFGLIHPSLKQSLDLRHDLLYAQFECDDLVQAIRKREYSEYSEFPAVRRDITLKVTLNEYASKISEMISDFKPDHLLQVNIVDNFKKNEEQFRRITYRITFQRLDRTLESSEMNGAMNLIINNLREKHQVELCT